MPPWPLLERIGTACGVPDLGARTATGQDQSRARLQAAGGSPLGVEVRLLIAEMATTVRAFSRRLAVNPSVLTRDLQRMDRRQAGEVDLRRAHPECRRPEARRTRPLGTDPRLVVLRQG